MDNAGRVSQDEYNGALDRRDRRIAELEAALRGLLAQVDQGHMANHFAMSPSTQEAVTAANQLLDLCNQQER